MTTFILDGIWGWHSRWESLRLRVEESVGPCKIWHYDNTGRTSLEVLGSRLAAELAALEEPFHLVGYSMGGLVVREAMRQAPGLPLQRSVLLHAPHCGTMTALLLPLAACREMRPGSSFLRRLEAEPWERETLATWCPGDLVIVPGVSARWHKASRHIRSDVPAHAWPVVSPSLHRAVIRFLKDGR